jgi:hypothetical protein
MSFAIVLARRLALRTLGAAGIGALSATAALAVPKAVVVEPAHLDIGEVEPGQPQKFDWTLRNDGDAVLSIESLEPTCYCTTGKADSWTIAPGTSTKVHVTVDPSDWVGDILKGVDIQTNDAQNKTVSLDVKMKVRPGIAVVPPELDFGAVTAQGSSAHTVDIKAGKERPFKVTSLAADVPYVTVEQDPLQTDDRVGVKLSVKIAPGVPAGPFATKIVVQTDDASRPRIEIPVRGAGPGGLAVNPAKIVFEAMAPGADLGTITVAGDKALKLTGVKSNNPAVEATIQGDGGTYTVKVSLAKTAKPGRLLAKLAIATSDAAQPELTVPVTGVVK